MYILLFILVRIAAFVLSLFIISRIVIFLNDKKIIKTRESGENKVGYFIVVISIVLLYFGLAELFTIPLDMYLK